MKIWNKFDLLYRVQKYLVPVVDSKASTRYSLYVWKLAQSTRPNVIREISSSILGGHRRTDVQQTTFDKVRTINAPSPSTL